MKNKIVAVTGGSGFLGKALVKRFLDLGAKEVRALGHSEEKQQAAKKLLPEAKWFIGDINDAVALTALLKGADIVIHAAAQKVIPVGEDHPSLTVDTNILGTATLARTAVMNGVKEVVLVSTDKACHPETVYGVSKMLGEKLFASYNKLGYDTKFYSCRYGNVAGSSGSIFEIWDREGKAGNTLKLTDPDMTRFYFSVDDAVDTILKTLETKDEEKPYIPKMKAIRMGLAADIFANHYGVSVEIIGNRGNEKVDEDLTDDINSATCEQWEEKDFIKFLKSIGCLSS